MQLDKQTQFSNSQALTATAVGTNTYDLSTDRSIGTGEPMAVVFNVEVAATVANGDEDYTFAVEYSSTADQSAGYVTMGHRLYQAGTPAVPAQDSDLLAIGYKVVVAIPPTVLADSARYIGVRYTLAGTDPTITVSAHLTPQKAIDMDVLYADGVTIV